MLSFVAEQDAVVHPLAPLQCQVHGHTPSIVVGVHFLHNSSTNVGFDATDSPFGEPQTQFTAVRVLFALQL